MIQQIEDLILTGKIEVGEKLPSERELSKELQISRSVVNRGLSELSRLGFIEMKPRQGNYVADYNNNGNLETLNVIINFNGGNYRPSLLKSIFNVRKVLENDMIRECNETTEFKNLNRALERIKNVETPIDKAETTFDFYHELAIASNNSVYPLLIQNFKSTYITLGIWLVQDGSGPMLEKNLELLVDELNNNDFDAALKNNSDTNKYCLNQLMK